MAYGRRSLENIETCSKPLQRIAHRAMEIAERLNLDLTCPEGIRGEEEQNEAYRTKRSKVKFPGSRHNKKPSQAIHILPYPTLWPTDKHKEKTKAKLLGRFYIVATIVRIVAKEEKVDIRWGGDWNRDGRIMDNDFDDLGHFETVPRKIAKGIGSM